MDGFRAETAELNRLPIATVGRLLGIGLPISGSCLCPFPDHADRNPSFLILRNQCSWKCYGCDRQGGAIDFVRYALGIDFVAAKKLLASKIHLHIPEPIPKSELRRQRIQNHRSNEEFAVIYSDFLDLCPMQKSGLLYLENRGLERETLEHFKVGQLPTSGEFISPLVNKFGLPALGQSGLLSGIGAHQNPRLVFDYGSLVFPIMQSGRIVALQSRNITPNTTRPKYINLSGIKPPTYNVDSLFSGRSTIAICEGIVDTMSAHQLGFAAIGLLGVANSLKPDEIEKLKNRKVVLLLDWDEAGERKAQKLHNEFRRLGILCVRKRQPNLLIKDLNDYIIYRQRNAAA